MRISGVSMDMAVSSINATTPGSLSETVGVKMLAEQMDMAEVQGAAMVKMMEQSVTPELGGNIDVSV